MQPFMADIPLYMASRFADIRSYGFSELFGNKSI